MHPADLDWSLLYGVPSWDTRQHARRWKSIFKLNKPSPSDVIPSTTLNLTKITTMIAGALATITPPPSRTLEQWATGINKIRAEEATCAGTAFEQFRNAGKTIIELSKQYQINT